jgi:hypothetical protein
MSWSYGQGISQYLQLQKIPVEDCVILEALVEE